MDTILGFLKDFCDWIVGAVSAVLVWFLDLIKEFVENLLSPLADALPDLSSHWDLSFLGPYIWFLEQWIAFDYGLMLLTAYFAFLLIMIPIKLIVKLFIPTVG